jgi:hypothetical protein
MALDARAEQLLQGGTDVDLILAADYAASLAATANRHLRFDHPRSRAGDRWRCRSLHDHKPVRYADASDLKQCLPIRFDQQHVQGPPEIMCRAPGRVP